MLQKTDRLYFLTEISRRIRYPAPDRLGSGTGPPQSPPGGGPVRGRELQTAGKLSGVPAGAFHHNPELRGPAIRI